MSTNLTVTNNLLGNVILKDVESQNDVFEFTGAATILEGTILARDSVSGNLIPFVKGGAVNDNGIPKAILTFEISATGAGTLNIRALIDGTVRKERLVIFGDTPGDVNIDDVVKDQLRDFSIVALSVKELNIQDNQ